MAYDGKRSRDGVSYFNSILLQSFMLGARFWSLFLIPLMALLFQCSKYLCSACESSVEHLAYPKTRKIDASNYCKSLATQP